MASICVFCGSRSGSNPNHTYNAARLAGILAAQGHTLVYGGGSVGLMGTLADEMLARGGHVVGVIPEPLARIEVMHPEVSDMRIVPDMHIRKATMHALADGYVALPGGYGTLEELFEVLCWGQLKLHAAPVAILNEDHFYDGLIAQVNHMVDNDFLTESCREILQTLTSADELESWLAARFAMEIAD